MSQGTSVVVRPRVLTADGERLLLEDLIAVLLAESAPRTLWLVAPGGAGLSTALTWLARQFPGAVRLHVQDQESPRGRPRADGIVVHAIRHGGDVAAPPADDTGPSRDPRQFARASRAEVVHLAPWGTDEILEYVQAAHPVVASDVLARALRARDLPLLRGFPSPTRAALDAMAADAALPDIRAALGTAVRRLLPDREAVLAARRGAVAALLQGDFRGLRALVARLPGAVLLRAWTVHVLLAADAVVDSVLEDPTLAPLLRVQLPRAVIRAAAARLRPWREARHAVRRALTGDHGYRHATAASILVASGDEWRPGPSVRYRLAGAHLEGARWEGAILTGADFAAACLDRARLGHARLERARFVGASLRSASLTGVHARRAVFEEADLTDASLSQALLRGSRFGGALLARARLDASDLTAADLSRTDLRDAVLDRACLRGATLTRAQLSRASMAGCDCRRADLSRQDLRGVGLEGARLSGARLVGATLSGRSLPGLRAPAANLEGAALGGVWAPGAQLRHANLHRASLPGAVLERADLRRAQLTEVDFGPRRAVRPAGPVALERARSRATLAGADLRGARLDGTDFYLVDLRGALYDDDQADYLRRCGAILDALASPP